MPRLISQGFLCLFFLICSLGFGQDIVEEIRVSGNKRVAEDSIRYRISIKTGDVINPVAVTRDMKILWETGLFQNIGVAVSDGQSGKILTFVVSELPLITEVDFRGYHKLTKSSITDKIEEEHLSIPEDTPLDYARINAIRKLVKEMLDEKGLRYGTVDYQLESLSGGSARIVFNINEGGKVRIYDVAFSGNTVFTDRKLAKTMKKIRKHWWLSWATQHDVFKDELFAEDVEKIRARYWKEGYKDIFVEEPVMDITDHTTDRMRRKNVKRTKKGKAPKADLRMKLTIPVYEGRAFQMGEFAILDNTVLREMFYSGSFPLNPGDPYDLGKINDWVTELEETHNNLGYVHFNMQQKIDIVDDNKVNVTWRVQENDQVYVHRLKFAGNTMTRDKVLRREVLIREGDVFRLNYFRNSLLRVNQLGFFDVSRDEPAVDFLPGENKVNITMKGQESGVNELNFGLGFSETRGSNGFLSFSTLNFLGKGEKLKVQAQVGSITDTFDVTFTEPWLFDKPRGVTARVFNTRTDFSAAGFSLESTGFQLGLTFRPTIFSTYGVSYSFSEQRFPNTTSPAFKPVDDLLTSSITQSLVYSTIDHPFFPTKGRKGQVIVNLASWEAGGDNFFYKVRLQGTQYFKAFGNTFIGLNAEGALLETLEGQRPVQNELFFLGGEESVRGYRRRSLGPTILDNNGNPIAILGDKLARANFEYIIPVSEQFRFVLFYDTGMIYGIDQEWFDTDLVRSTGAEMRFSLPIFQAPLRLMYVYRLDDTPLDDRGGEPDFSIGTTF